MAMYIKPYRSRRYRLNTSQEAVERDVHVPLNVRKEDGEFVIEMIVPGLTPDDLDIEIIKNKVIVQGEFLAGGDDESYLRQEIPTGKFQREIKLPKTLEVEGSQANLEHGVLSLRVPVAEEALPRTIKVKTN